MSTTAIVEREREFNKSLTVRERQAQELCIETPDHYEIGCRLLQIIDREEGGIHEFFDPDIKKADELHKSLLGKRNRFLNGMVLAKNLVKRKISDYLTRMEIARLAEERRQSEAARVEAEQRAGAQAAELIAQGEPELAAMVVEEQAAAPMPVVVLPTTVPKAEGVAGRDIWKYRVVDESKIPREYLMVNHTAIGAVVRSQKSMARIPGVEVFSEKTVAVRG